MNKTLSKEIIKSAYIRAKYLKSKSGEHRQSHAEKIMRISIKKEKKEFLFDLKREKCHRQLKVLENLETSTFQIN